MRSDHLNDWSEELGPVLGRSSAPETVDAPATAAAAPCAGPGFAHRALQALWEAGLQVCPRTWARTQVLPLGEPLRGTAPHGVCPRRRSRRGRSLARELPPRARNPRGGLRDQPRALAPQRGAWLSAREICHYDRHRGHRDPHGPHGSVPFGDRAPERSRVRARCRVWFAAGWAAPSCPRSLAGPERRRAR